MISSSDTKKLHYANKAITYSFYLPLHWDAVLMHDCI